MAFGKNNHVPQSFPNLGMDVFRNQNLIPISRLAVGRAVWESMGWDCGQQLDRNV